jgi:conjugative transfer pilus assembly protein TraH
MRLNKSLIAALILFTLPVQAGLNNVTDDLFGAYQNVTPGAAYEGQNRYVLSGGSIVTKNPIKNANLFSFTPPKITAGCRGISAYGGSFSFINKAEFTQLLRTIASNAVGYAFQLALDSLCPTCMATMRNLQDTIQKINSKLKNSCEMAKLMVDKTGDTFKSALSFEQTKVASFMGSVGGAIDNFDANVLGETKTPKEQLDTASPALVQQEPSVKPQNIVWAAINETSAANWFGDNSNEMKELLMSVSGTIVKSSEDKSGNAANCTDGTNATWCYNEYPGTLGYKDILLGTYDKAGGPRRVTLLKCDEYNDCLSVTSTDVTTGIDGLTKRVREILVGTASINGIIQKLRSKSVLNENDKKFIESSPVPIKALLMRVIASEGAMHTIANESIDAIAELMAAELMYAMIRSTRSAVLLAHIQLKSKMLSRLDKVEGDYQTYRQEAVNTSKRLATVLEIAERVRTSTIKRQNSGAISRIGSRINPQ